MRLERERKKSEEHVGEESAARGARGWWWNEGEIRYKTDSDRRVSDFSIRLRRPI